MSGLVLFEIVMGLFALSLVTVLVARNSPYAVAWLQNRAEARQTATMLAEQPAAVIDLLTKGSYRLDPQLMLTAEERWTISSVGDVVTFDEWIKACPHWDAEIRLIEPKGGSDGHRFVTVACPNCGVSGEFWWPDWIDARYAWARQHQKCAMKEWAFTGLKGVEDPRYSMWKLKEACDCPECTRLAEIKRQEDYRAAHRHSSGY